MSIKPKILLRTASMIMLLHVIGHSFGIGTWEQTMDPVKQTVINQMSQHKFPFMGSIRSLADSFNGFGYGATLSMLLIVFLLWAISSQIKGNESLAKLLLSGIAVFLFAWGIDEMFFFFPLATAFSLISAVLTTISLFSIQKHPIKK